MKFSELQKIMEENYGADRPADIARELNVTPQAVNNWKIRDLVPYKYVRKIRIGLKSESDENIGISATLPMVQEQFNFEPYFKFFYKNTKILFLIVFVLTFFQLIYLLFFVEPVFISSAKILPSNPQSRSMSKAIGIASQLGISKQNTQSVELNSAELFPDIIKSRTLAKKIMDKRITIPGSSKKEVELYKLILKLDNNVTDYDKNIVLNAAIKIFHGQIVSVYKMNRMSPLINLSVKTNNKYLSKIIASLIITELDKTQNNFKLKNTVEKKYFIEQRLIQVQNELAQAENTLKIFVDKNRNILSSPALMLERERLLRDVEMRNQVYITMKTEYELIKIEEIGKRTMVAVLDPPEVPTEKSGGSRKSKLILIIFIALMIDMLIIILGVNAKNILVKSKFLNFLFKY